MKKLLFLLAFLSFWFLGKSQVKVGADKSFDASISDYNTYAWSTKIDEIPKDAIFVGPNGVMVFNNETTRSKIKEAIQYQLDAKGYKMDTSNPDMIITFKVLEQPATLNTFNGYSTFNNGLHSTRTPENTETVNAAPGTLLINIVDAKSSKVAWQSYASGILKPDMANDDAKIRQAVTSMFDQFKYTAKK